MRNVLWTATALAVMCWAAAALGAGPRMTCGQMTAKFASQPAALASLAGAWADQLAAHADAVGKTDPVASKSEVEGLSSIVKHFRAAATELAAAASEMRAATAWKDTKHDVAKMRADAKIGEAKAQKIKALTDAAAETQKEIDFWKTMPTASPK